MFYILLLSFSTVLFYFILNDLYFKAFPIYYCFVYGITIGLDPTANTNKLIFNFNVFFFSLGTYVCQKHFEV